MKQDKENPEGGPRYLTWPIEAIAGLIIAALSGNNMDRLIIGVVLLGDVCLGRPLTRFVNRLITKADLSTPKKDINE